MRRWGLGRPPALKGAGLRFQGLHVLLGLAVLVS